MCGRAYQLFSKVVHYAESSQGIESITINKNEALATIRIPDSHIGSGESAVKKHCDTVSIDMFLEVSGLLINSSSACSRDQVFITSGLESVTMSKLCDFGSVKEWNVYTISTLNLAAEEPESDERQVNLFRLISELYGVDVSLIQESQSLADLGFDSLSTTELGSSFSDELNVNLESTNVLPDCSVIDLMQLAGIFSSKQKPRLSKPPVSTVKSVPTSSCGRAAGVTDPFKSLVAAESSLPVYATNCQYTGYLTEAAARQDELLLAYMTEELQKLGVDLKALRIGQKIPSFSYQPKHSRVVQRYYEILQKHKVIEKKGPDCVRSSTSCKFAPSSRLWGKFLADFPQYSCEAELMSLTGSKVAECLTGTEDPIKLLFGNPKAQEIIENFYAKATMFATLTELLVDFLLRLAKNAHAPISILEVGAGTGGTTKRVIEALSNLNYPIESEQPQLPY